MCLVKDINDQLLLNKRLIFSMFKSKINENFKK